jgi:transglutaminase-like putative cysteine protease
MSGASGARVSGNAAGISGRSWVDLGVLLVLSTLGIVGFETSFGNYNFLLAGLGGLAVGAVGAIVARLLRFGPLVSIITGLVLYFLAGTPIVMPALALFGVLPSVQSITGLAVGALFGWSDILTLQTPVQAPYYISVIPYFASWVVALVGGLLALQWLPKRRTVWRTSVLVVAPALLFLAGILLGTSEPYYAAIRGIAFGGLTLLWLGWRRNQKVNVAVEGRGRISRVRFVGTAIVLLGAIAIGTLGGSAIAPARENRFVLRETITPPFDPAVYPSPLSGFRKYTKDLNDSALFTVTGLEPEQRIRLATLDTYDGTVWSVSSNSSDTGSGTFSLVGKDVPPAPLLTSTQSATLDFTIEDYTGVWIPDVGYPSTLTFTDSVSSALSDDLRYNAASGTAVLTDGLVKGYSYSITTDLQDAPSDASLKDVPVASIELPAVDTIPDIVVAKAVEFAGSSTSPIEQLRSIEAQLKTTGYLSHGLESDPVASRSGHGADRMVELFTAPQMVGDQEQFASAFALMARHFGYPTRLVMGFAPEVSSGQSSATIVGDDITVWDEVAFEGVGWVAFDPTPTQTDVPQDPAPKPHSEPQPQVLQPPRTSGQDDSLLTAVDIDDTKKDEKNLFSIPGWAYVVGAIILIPLALYFVPFLVVAWFKGRRSRRRRKALPERSVAGAWEELVDRYYELGIVSERRLTRVAQSRVFEEQVLARSATEVVDRPLPRLASQIDTDVFGGASVSDETADARWRDVEQLVADAERASTRLQRQLSRFRLRAQRGARGLFAAAMTAARRS